jgi:hypothetical protein
MQHLVHRAHPATRALSRSRLICVTRRTRQIRLLSVIALMLVAAGCSKKKTPTEPPIPKTTSRNSLVPASNSAIIEARTSQIYANGSLPALVTDDFTFTGASNITKVGWQGIYCVQTPGAAAPAPTATGFTITFYADAAGRPNVAAPLQTQTFTLAQANQVFDKNVSGLTCGTAANTTWPFYSYSATLTTAFPAAANTKYWIGIQALSPSFAVFWGWRDGVPDNNQSWQLFNGTFTSFPFDRAYSLAP